MARVQRPHNLISGVGMAVDGSEVAGERPLEESVDTIDKKGPTSKEKEAEMNNLPFLKDGEGKTPGGREVKRG